jgi:hypothetical protein
MSLTCDRITDLLPELAAGTLPQGTATTVHAHVRECASCAAEWSIVQVLRAGAPVSGDVMQQRIISAVRSATAPVPAGRWGVKQLTIAATVAVALIGGALATEQLRRDTTTPVVPTSDTVTAAAPVYTTADAPVIGGSVVSELNEKQLEALLAEMDS